MPSPLTPQYYGKTEQKWYLHAAADATAGTTKPSAKQSAATPTDAITAISNRRSATPTIGTSQTSVAKTTSASTSLQKNFFVDVFIMQSVLAAQTFGAGSWTINGAASESNTNANMGWSCCIYVWRPSTGALVGRILDMANAGAKIGNQTLNATGQSLISGSSSGNNVTSAQGDLLVFEFWEVSTQAMATAYTDTMFYDGTTEASTTSCATFVQAPTPIYIINPLPGSARQQLQAVNRGSNY